MLQLIETADGSHSLFSEEYGSSYHSRLGAVQESKYVFIENGLHFVAKSHRNINVLEMGFGTGLNAWLTLLAARQLDLNIRYTAIEAYPVPPEIVAMLNYPSLLPSEDGQVLFDKIHNIAWSKETELTKNFSLKKIHCRFEVMDLLSGFDLVYYDAFGPEIQPALWEAPLVQRVYEALIPGGVLVTFCAKGAFKRALKAVGFTVEPLPGPPGKREVTRAVK